MKRIRRDPMTQEGIKASIRQAFAAEEAKRDEAHEAVVNRLIRNLDEFTKGAGNESHP